MYLSWLLIDVGDNPDRPRPGRLWLRNLYHVHQRLCMAFPSAARVRDDPKFLQPFTDDNFPSLRNPHAAPEQQRHSFLFRIDNRIRDNCPSTIILVQSDQRPNWDYAFGLKPGLVDPRTGKPIGNAGHLLAAPPATREFAPVFSAGQELRFRIRVNLSKKSRTGKEGRDLRRPREGTDAHGRQRDQSKRVALTWNSEEGQQPGPVIREWFEKKVWVKPSEDSDRVQTFKLCDCNVLQLGWVVGYKPKVKDAKAESANGDDGDSARQMKFRSALLEGTLVVKDASAFAKVIASGIGSAKAFGFGLLSVAPVS
jgi:CRISPR system Cascade subunit CasE